MSNINENLDYIGTIEDISEEKKEYMELELLLTEELYNENCKLSAYLCDLFNISPKGKVNNIFTICEYDEKLIAWLEKIGKSLTSLRDDVAKLMGTSASMITPVIPEAPKVEKELFRVRKSWEDAASQAGAFTDFENAKKACDKAGDEYEV